MSLTTNPNDERLLNQTKEGQHETYLVLSDEELAKGFVRPYRDAYIHVGEKPTFALKDLTEEQKERYLDYSYVKFEEYPESESPITGRYWTDEQLRSGCKTVTTMGQKLSETYAREPKFYGATFCANCNKHFPVKEFQWVADNQTVGS